jgi:hypothetical protein
MHFFTLILLLVTLLLVGVCHGDGNEMAHSYECVFLWDAHQVELLAFGAGNHQIAPGCVGSRPDGTCYFQEFVEFITDKQFGGDLISPRDNLNPPVDETAHFLEANRMGGGIVAGNVWPGVASWGDVYTNVGARMAQAKAAVPMSLIQTHLSNVDIASLGSLHARIKDFQGALLSRTNRARFMAEYDAKGVEIQIKRVRSQIGQYDKLDFRATVALYAESRPGLAQELHASIRQHIATAENRGGRNHYRVIKALKGERARRNFGCS